MNAENKARIANGVANGGGIAAVAQAGEKIVNVSNVVAVPLMVAVDTARVGVSVRNDMKHQTSRNTVSTVATVASGWGGGVGGAMAGAAIGSAVIPVIGTFFGGLIGCIAGGIGGRAGSGAIVNAIGDGMKYDIQITVCTECKTEFECRVYIEGRRTLCDDCEAKRS